MQNDAGIDQTGTCRIRELEAELGKLRATGDALARAVEQLSMRLHWWAPRSVYAIDYDVRAKALAALIAWHEARLP